MRIYLPNSDEKGIGGGWTFLRNFRKALASKVQFVDSWQECDVFFITGITLVNKDELYEAHKAGKRIVLRVDNVPRKSRNERSTPHERLKEFAGLSDVVIYQSQWAKDYCYPLCGDGTIIYNGVDRQIFNTNTDPSMDKEARENRYLFAFHGKNDVKLFPMAHLFFELEARKNPKAEFWFIYDFGQTPDRKGKTETQKMQQSNFDFWNGENISYLPKQTTPEAMAKIMQQCKYLIYPAISDASPNAVSEALACGMEIVCPSERRYSGTVEIIENWNKHNGWSIHDMAEEYYNIMKLF